MVNRLGAGTKVGQLGIWDGTQWVAGDPDCNIVKWGGTALTGRDITTLLDHLNVNLDTRASEATLIASLDTNKFRTLPIAKGKTTIRRNAAVTAGGTAVIYSVTAGKTFYLVSAWCSLTLQAANMTGVGGIDCDTGGDGIFGALALVSAWTATGAVNSGSPTLSITPCIPMPFTAGTLFRVLVSGPNLECDGGIMGWEE